MEANLTRDGIAKNLEFSPYNYSLEYVREDVAYKQKYYFSSKMYKRKFIDQYKGYREKVNNWLSGRLGMSIEVNAIADVVLYHRIEKRGFYVEQYGERPNEYKELEEFKEVFTCQEQVKLNGALLTKTL